MKRLALILPIISGILWGSTGPFVRMLVAAGLNNITVFFSRVLIASILLFFFLLIYNRSLLRIKIKDIWMFALAGGVGTLGLNICYNESILHLSLSLAAVLLALMPVYVVIIAAIVFKEKITSKKVICMILAFAGCVLVSGVLEQSGQNLTVTGILIGVLSGVLYSFYSIFSRVAGDRGYHAFTIIFYSMLIAMIVLIPFADWNALGTYVAEAPAAHTGILVVHSLLSSVLPYIFFTIGLIYAETGTASILGAAGEPAAATIFGLIIYAEVPSVLSIAGLVLTIIALALLVRTPKAKTG